MQADLPLWLYYFVAACLASSVPDQYLPRGGKPHLDEPTVSNISKPPLKEIDFSRKQGFHPNPKRFTRIRQTDPIPYSLEQLKNDPYRDKHVIHKPPANSRVDLLIMVESSPSSESWRKVVRATWGSSIPQHVRIVFVIPIADDDSQNVLEEIEAHQDIILFKLISSSTIASVRLMHYIFWCNALYDYSHLLRTNDKYFIRVSKMFHVLASFRTTDLVYMGYFRGDVSVNEEVSWFVCPSLVPHADEGAYLLSRALTNRFVSQFYYLSYFHSEGASVGLWTSPFNDVQLVHRIDFDSLQSRGCLNTLLTMSETSVEEMRERFDRLINRKQFCTKEFVMEKSYEYDWSKLPSQCCKNPMH